MHGENAYIKIRLCLSYCSVVVTCLRFFFSKVIKYFIVYENDDCLLCITRACTLCTRSLLILNLLRFLIHLRRYDYLLICTLLCSFIGTNKPKKEVAQNRKIAVVRLKLRFYSIRINIEKKTISLSTKII